MTVVLCPETSADLRSLAESARDAGFTAVELSADDRVDADSVSNLLWSSVKAVQDKIGDVTVSSVRTAGDWPTIRRAVVAAGSVGCRLVRAVGVDLSAAKDRYRTAREVGDLAAAAGVVVAIELPGIRHGVTAVWSFVDAVGHPAVGCCWTATEAATAGVSIPTLSNWIRAARITADDRAAVDRLHGIGFQGPWLIGPSRDAKMVRDQLLSK